MEVIIMYKCPICDKQRSIDLQYPIWDVITSNQLSLVDGVTNFTFCTDCYNETRQNYWNEQERLNIEQNKNNEFVNINEFAEWLKAIAYTRECHQFELSEA
jgi:hypothetical protein|tara:strand:+ start:251 stop:553 length:303 start_codon:yes stop_codon:yes gene_type:complete